LAQCRTATGAQPAWNLAKNRQNPRPRCCKPAYRIDTLCVHRFNGSVAASRTREVSRIRADSAPSGARIDGETKIF